jgi:serine/threonine protein kinase/formylglycine-generating enzyme required for sulfatase activity
LTLPPDPLLTDAEEAGQPVSPADPSAVTMPSAIGRYRVMGRLGEGSFGSVYKCHDGVICREVTVKVPHPALVSRPGDVEAFLNEARVLAALEHPHIVPVFDAGCTDDGLCFVVSKFIEGTDLKARIGGSRLGVADTVELVAAVAEALHHAHVRGLVHRDVKPANILIDTGGKPYLTDFGLALKEEEYGKGAAFAGTPAYMSPEQARWEGHRVDGRSDLFSLGIVFYELLTGRRPFQGETREELLERIATAEPRPPRQIDDALPRELERICLKALAKRASERYTTGRDLADDLRHWLTARTATPTAPVTSEAEPLIRIIPKGLRSFDAHDADFFLELLPGPCDRDGLPESIRFWKRRIEEADPEGTFPVGLLYGPSGCGKSSLVKAGLLPRLADHVMPVYVEATTEETESRLLYGLRKRCPELPSDLGLKETLVALRQGRYLPAGTKVLVVLDQFEQWLHAHRAEEDAELVEALRQCDGGRVQCLVLVRDDFWLAISRFLRDLEIRLLEGHNSALVDLFDPDHARKVLTAFGRAFGKLSPGERTRDQDDFLCQAVAGLGREGKVVCVRLALFAEMMKGKPWTPASLKAVGGTQGVGATFLEETFSASTAPPAHRLHQKAARAVLKALLPESGSDIKGHMRSEEELRTASGYARSPRDFEELIGFLDGEVRLLTPTDPEGRGAEEDAPSPAPVGQRYYQLTHDYLVPSLRDWLTRKQRETRRGRAELRLAERAALWQTKRENRLLPSWWECLNIRLLTRRRDWTAPQCDLMRKADRYHVVRGLVLLAVLVVVVGVGWEGFGRLQARVLRNRLLEATTQDVPGIVGDMGPYRRWLDPSLRQALAEAEADGDERKHLHASLALLPVDPGQVEYLYGRLLAGGPEEVVVLRDALRPHAEALDGRLWAVLEEPADDPEQKLRAACALAAWVPEDDRWENVNSAVAARLVGENPVVIGKWAEALQPVGRFLLEALAARLLAEGRGAAEQRTAAGLYAAFAGGEPAGFAPLEEALAEEAEPGAMRDVRLALARRKANVAASLAAMARWENVWPLLRQARDPTVRTYLIDRLGPGGVEAQTVVEQIRPEKGQEVSIRRALVLALGEYDGDRLPPDQRASLVPQLMQWYREDPDPGMHGALGWLLRQWGQQDKTAEIDQALRGEPRGPRRWYVNGQGQTMVVVSPGEFWMGEGKERHRRRIARYFALAAGEVTVAEFLRFRKERRYLPDFTPTEDCPINNVTWAAAAAYCNWLSKEEGIPKDQWCYAPNAQGNYVSGMKVKAGYLDLAGYRLPTEAEWEYACRAGSETDWSMGQAEDLLPKYAWILANSNRRFHPVATLRPNAWGLFDLHGNVWEWCQDRYAAFPEEGADRAIVDEDDREDLLNLKAERVCRGGSSDSYPWFLRSAHRLGREPAYRPAMGFRPARTLP